jgi:hypothetical protein
MEKKSSSIYTVYNVDCIEPVTSKVGPVDRADQSIEACIIYMNLLARLIRPPGPPVPPRPPPPFMYIFIAISAAELIADCLSPDYISPHY